MRLDCDSCNRALPPLIRTSPKTPQARSVLRHEPRALVTGSIATPAIECCFRLSRQAQKRPKHAAYPATSPGSRPQTCSQHCTTRPGGCKLFQLPYFEARTSHLSCLAEVEGWWRSLKISMKQKNSQKRALRKLHKCCKTLRTDLK